MAQHLAPVVYEIAVSVPDISTCASVRLNGHPIARFPMKRAVYFEEYCKTGLGLALLGEVESAESHSYA